MTYYNIKHALVTNSKFIQTIHDLLGQIQMDFVLTHETHTQNLYMAAPAY